MQTNLAILFLLALTIFGRKACNENPVTEISRDYKVQYDKFQVEGSFVLFDPQSESYTVYNPEQLKKEFIPASTFKICNSLIGLETGVIRDENFVIPWDSIQRNAVWDKDHDLKTAFKNSTVWYYQELARRVGAERMKSWLDKAAYGNADTTGGIDQFWLQGGLRITPLQQIDFLSRFYNHQLPFSERSMDITRKIMLEIDTLDYKVYGKRGWAGQDGKEIGWYIGFVEKKDKVYYFVNCVQADSKEMDDDSRATAFDHSRKEIAMEILGDLNIVSK